MKNARKALRLLLSVLLIVCVFACLSAPAMAAGLGGIPLTGDESNLPLWLTVGAVALVGLGCAVVIILKKK